MDFSFCFELLVNVVTDSFANNLTHLQILLFLFIRHFFGRLDSLFQIMEDSEIEVRMNVSSVSLAAIILLTA